jgi:K+-transporting ATPase KdpF subunit
MSFEDALGLVLAILALAYLVFALIYPERVG